LEKDLSHCHFNHFKSHMDWLSIELGPPRCEAAKFFFTSFETNFSILTSEFDIA
jgi:hypothetical protein